jgi:hypothetical protein
MGRLERLLDGDRFGHLRADYEARLRRIIVLQLRTSGIPVTGDDPPPELPPSTGAHAQETSDEPERRIGSLGEFVRWSYAEHELESSKLRHDIVNLAMNRVGASLRASAVRFQFERAMRVLVVGALIALVGIAGFVIAVDSGSSTAAADEIVGTVSHPVPVGVVLTDEGRQLVDGAAGDGCGDALANAYVLRSSDDGYDLLTVSTEGCPAVQVRLSAEQAQLSEVCERPDVTTTTDTTTTTTTTTSTTLVLAFVANGLC